MEKFAVGEKVKLNGEALMSNPKFAGTIFEVVKVPVGARGVNYSLKPVGSEQRVKAPYYFVEKANAKEATAASAIKATENTPEIFHMGELFTIENSPKFEGKVLVVLGNSRQMDHYKAAVLGGDNGYYYSKISARLMKRYTGKTVNL